MNTKKSITITIIIGVLVGAFILTRNKNSDEQIPQTATITKEDSMISEKGIHWHPELSIFIKGEKQLIPTNIGIGMQYAGYPLYDPMMMMTDMHTHDDSGTLHWEIMEGPVKKEDVRLANLFAIWGRRFDENCIFESCNGPEGKIIMLVNGKENTEFQNYLVNDKDKIEIRYE